MGRLLPHSAIPPSLAFFSTRSLLASEETGSKGVGMRLKEENREGGEERGRGRKFCRLPPLARPLFLRHLLDRKLISITREHKENAGRSRQLFLRILNAHGCTCKFTCTSYIERARQVLKWTMIGQMAIAIALLGFNDLGRSVTPTFLFRNRFCLQLSPRHLVQKWTKNQCGKLKNLFFEKPHQLTKFA